MFLIKYLSAVDEERRLLELGKGRGREEFPCKVHGKGKGDRLLVVAVSE